MYFEDLFLAPNAGIGLKDFFETASKVGQVYTYSSHYRNIRSYVSNHSAKITPFES